MVREIRPKLKFFIYSGNWNKVIANVVGKEHNEATIDDVRKFNKIGILIHYLAYNKVKKRKQRCLPLKQKYKISEIKIYKKEKKQRNKIFKIISCAVTIFILCCLIVIFICFLYR